MIQNNTSISIADMHTHSEHSHDSMCKIEDMLLSQIEKGTRIFAVTDHFDTDSYKDFDIFTPIENAFNEVAVLNEKYNGQCTVLSGLEISEGFWHPDVYNKIINFLPYDVVIGSVHVVNYKNITGAYSCVDFSKLDKATIAGFLDKYFDDMITMLDNENFDILAHLTCPLRYIIVKYKIDIDLSPYQDKIEEILRKIIQRGIALEINTSIFYASDEFMPSRDILRKYHEMGGYLLTLASDAHVSQNASIHFTEAIDTLKEIGFKNIYYYKKRKAYPINI